MIKKRYYYPSPIAIDRFNTRVLRALSVKLSRDYLGFFGNLSKLYTKGENKKRLVLVVNKVGRSVALLNSMISTAKVSKEDVETLVEDIEEINESRDYFVEQAEQNKSLGGKIQKVSDVTGVSIQDLNITKETIQKGTAQVQRRTREGTLPFAKRTMPGVIGLGAELGKETLGAVAGPFAPVLEMASALVKGLAGAGVGIKEKIQERREEKLAGKLAPMARGFEPSAFERLGARRGVGMPITGFEGISRRGAPRVSSKEEMVSPSYRGAPRKPSKEEMVFPLTYFFDKKAHKAKWTKEVLSRFKSMEKAIHRIGGKGLAGLGGLFSNLTKGVLPLIGKFALLTAGIGAAILSFTKIKQAIGVIKEFREAKKGLVESKKAMKVAAGTGPGTWEQELLTREDPVAALKQYTKEGKIAPQIAKTIRERMTPEYVKAHKKAAQWESEAVEAKLLTKRLGVGAAPEELLEEMPSTIRDPFSRGSGEEIKQGMDGVQKAVEKVNDTLSRQQGSDVKGAGLGDPYGVGDPLVMGLSRGEISLGND